MLLLLKKFQLNKERKEIGTTHNTMKKNTTFFALEKNEDFGLKELKKVAYNQPLHLVPFPSNYPPNPT